MGNELTEKLENYGQLQLCEQFKKLNKEEQEQLIEQVKEVNFEEIKQLQQLIGKKATIAIQDVQPIAYTEKNKLTQEQIKDYENIGREIIKQGKYAVITMAGGQGTRLGHKGPKGTYVVNVKPKPQAIFSILANKIKQAQVEHGVDIPWYIMTSADNDNSTKQFFEENNYFGLSSNTVNFFKQSDIPLLDEKGNIILGENKKIKTGGSGNGGIYEALETQGVLKEFKQKQIEWVLVAGVDNILVKMADLLFIGLTAKNKTPIGCKSVTKRDASESVGVFCKKNSKTGIVEYVEITDEMRNMKDEEGKLVYGQSNIAQHLFSYDALEKIKDVKMKYHLAHKKNAYLDENLNLITPTEPNTYKFEKFIFDVFEEFEDITLLNVKREEEFAPIKNATGNDSPETASKLYNEEEARCNKQ